MFEARKLIRLLKTEYLQKRIFSTCTSTHFCERGQQRRHCWFRMWSIPQKTEQSQCEWMHGLIAFLIEHVFPIGQHGKRDMIKKFLGEEVFGDVSSKSQAPEADGLGAVDVCGGASQESIMPEVGNLPDEPLDTRRWDNPERKQCSDRSCRQQP